MLDSFDSINPDDYTAGFPMHPHRGSKRSVGVSRGKMVHRDSLGNEAGISDGEVQWMNSAPELCMRRYSRQKGFRSTVVAEFTGKKIK